VGNLMIVAMTSCFPLNKGFFDHTSSQTYTKFGGVAILPSLVMDRNHLVLRCLAERVCSLCQALYSQVVTCCGGCLKGHEAQSFLKMEL